MNIGDIFQAFNDLDNKSKQQLLYELFKKDATLYPKASVLYVQSLNDKVDLDNNIKGELSACLLLEMENYDRKNRKDKDLIHRHLAILDKTKYFNINGLKERENYNEKIGKDQGIFWNSQDNLIYDPDRK